MDDTSGIRLLAGLVDILRDKNGSAKLLSQIQAHEDAAAASLAEAAEIHAATATKLTEAKGHHDSTARLRDEMLNKLTPREAEVAKGAQFVQDWQKKLDARDKEIAQRETEMTRRENAAAARESKLLADEAKVRSETARVALMKESYDTKLANIKKAATG